MLWLNDLAVPDKKPKEATMKDMDLITIAEQTNSAELLMAWMQQNKCPAIGWLFTYPRVKNHPEYGEIVFFLIMPNFCSKRPILQWDL